MQEYLSLLLDRKALEKAAKYICNHYDGLCPMVVEKISCRVLCSTETLPWHCWLLLFKERAVASEEKEEAGG